MTVVVSDITYDGPTKANRPPDLWPITERRELAERTRSNLLDPNGPENQAAEMKGIQPPRKRKKDHDESGSVLA